MHTHSPRNPQQSRPWQPLFSLASVVLTAAGCAALAGIDEITYDGKAAGSAGRTGGAGAGGDETRAGEAGEAAGPIGFGATQGGGMAGSQSGAGDGNANSGSTDGSEGGASGDASGGAGRAGGAGVGGSASSGEGAGASSGVGGGGGAGASNGGAGASGGNAVGGAGGSSAGGAPTCSDPLRDELNALGDEFDAEGTIGDWSDLEPALHRAFDIDATRAGHLVLSPSATAYTGWYSAGHGPFIYKRVAGNFVVETRLKVVRHSQPSERPLPQYNAAGIMVRNPVLQSGENWIKFDLGAQHGGMPWARNVKSTVSSYSEPQFMSNETADTISLRICRLDDDFRLFHRERDEASWSATIPSEFTRSDLPEELEVGFVADVWLDALDVRGEYDFIRFGRPTEECDCTASLPPAR